MAKTVIFPYEPEDLNYRGTAEALADLARSYAWTAKAVRMANKQLVKFDELNRLAAPPEETVKTGSSGKSSSASAKRKSVYDSYTPKEPEPIPAPSRLMVTLKDVLFDWTDLNPEQIAMKALAGFTALGGAIIGGLVGGVPGAVIGLAAGLSFGLVMDSLLFNFDGELSDTELQSAVIAALPVVGGGIAGFILGGPFGAMLGVTLGMLLSFKLLGLDWSDITGAIGDFFTDLTYNFDYRWAGFVEMISGAFNRLKNWWRNLSLGSFTFKVPHLRVDWQELASNSILARYLGITAIPHLSVDWYARGGIVDGATLIGAGEKGKEAIIPLERNTGWIRSVAEELREQLELHPPKIDLTPPMAAGESSRANTLQTLEELLKAALTRSDSGETSEPAIHIYLDGKQLSDVVTRYQRRAARAGG